MRVVEDDEAESLISSGVWFDSPLKAKAYKEKVEEKIKREKKAQDTPTLTEIEKSKSVMPKDKLKEKSK